MSGRLSIDFTDGEGAVVRLLGLVERRGFHVRSISMAGEGEQASMQIHVEPRDAGRSLDVLDLQLRRIVGVRSVSFSSDAAGALQ